MSTAVASTVRLQPAPARPVRVLWLIKGLGPGGAELLLSMIAQVRDRELFAYEAAYLLPWKRDLVAELEDQGVTVHCLRGGREWNLGWALRLRSLLLRRRYDIVHLHSPYVAGIARLVVRSMPHGTRPRMISTEHVPWSGYAASTRALNAGTFLLDDAHITVSRAVQESIPPALRGRTIVVEHGIFVDRVREQARQRDDARRELEVEPNEVLIGTVANFRDQKGYPNLLRAARRVIDTGSPVRFVAVGHGPRERDVRTLHRQLRLDDRFLLTGYREDATRVLAGCDVFVLASLYEGLPLALMEAMALGLPVVATDVDGTRDAIEHGIEALMVPPGRPDRLAQALETLVRDPSMRRRLGRSAAARAEDFDITRAARRIESLYREVAG